MTRYEKPEIADYGDLTTLTESTNTGNEFDANFAGFPGFNILSCDPTSPIPCVTISGP
jgi:hypothetical protein